MKRQEPSPSEADLQRLLQQLGRQGEPQTRDGAQESTREARMADRMDAELEGLVAAHRLRRRVLFGLACAAALVALMVGVRSAHWGARSLAILPEPVTGSKPPALQSAQPAPSAPAAPLTRPSPTPRPSAAGAPTGPPAPSAREPRSTLAEENQLFKDAAESARNGDVNEAVSRLERLVAEHPASPLAQTALVRKFRLLAKTGRSDEARHEAERYLAAYPTGFAVSEARALQAAGAGQHDTP
jgi:outer membrane lipoprotein YfiO